MAIIEIPTRNDLEAYTFNIDLDGKTYLFDIQWNARSEKWYLNLFNDSEVELINGIPLVINYNLLKRFVDTNLPQGRLFLLDASDKNEECGQFDLGTRCLLLYEEVAT